MMLWGRDVVEAGNLDSKECCGRWGLKSISGVWSDKALQYWGDDCVVNGGVQGVLWERTT